MEHDPLCPQPHCDFGEPDGDCMGYEDCWHWCQCSLISRIRNDERKRSDLYMQGYADGRSDAKELSEINATVYYNYGYNDGYTAAKRDAVEAVTNAGVGHDSKYQKEIDIFAIQSLGEEQ